MQLFAVNVGRCEWVSGDSFRFIQCDWVIGINGNERQTSARKLRSAHANNNLLWLENRPKWMASTLKTANRQSILLDTFSISYWHRTTTTVLSNLVVQDSNETRLHEKNGFFFGPSVNRMDGNLCDSLFRRSKPWPHIRTRWNERVNDTKHTRHPIDGSIVRYNTELLLVASLLRVLLSAIIVDGRCTSIDRVTATRITVNARGREGISE